MGDASLLFFFARWAFGLDDPHLGCQVCRDERGATEGDVVPIQGAAALTKHLQAADRMGCIRTTINAGIG